MLFADLREGQSVAIADLVTVVAVSCKSGRVKLGICYQDGAPVSKHLPFEPTVKLALAGKRLAGREPDD